MSDLSYNPHIYITPTGYMCTCGGVVITITGAQAARMAYDHRDHAHFGNKDVVITDYRVAPNAANGRFVVGQLVQHDKEEYPFMVEATKGPYAWVSPAGSVIGDAHTCEVGFGCSCRAQKLTTISRLTPWSDL